MPAPQAGAGGALGAHRTLQRAVGVLWSAGRTGRFFQSPTRQAHTVKRIIIANPAAGNLSPQAKTAALDSAARILGAAVFGMDLDSPAAFARCAREASSRCDLLVVAGGDGTVSDVINAIDTSRHPIAYLPLGTGNALRYALGYPRALTAVARRIRDGRLHAFDLIDCDRRRRAFMASVGLDGTVIRLSQRLRHAGRPALEAYLRAAVGAYFRKNARASGLVTCGATAVTLENLLSLTVMKQPYYGLGMQIEPRARFDDGCLHVRGISSGLVASLWGVLSSFTVGNRIGRYWKGPALTAAFDRPLWLQTDGNEAWQAERFTFEVLPGALKIVC